jgi:hypothetical protein
MISIPRSEFAHRIIRSIALLAITMIVIGCQIPTSGFSTQKASQIQKLLIKEPKFTLAWDDDSTNANHYNVYSRVHNTSTWDVVTVGLASTSLVLTNSQLPYGDYDFAVRSVANDGTESPLLISSDPSAASSTGWYLEWIP